MIEEFYKIVYWGFYRISVIFKDKEHLGPHFIWTLKNSLDYLVVAGQ